MSGSIFRRKDVLSWCLYDWANSAFVTSIITVVLPVYFLTLVPENGVVTVRVGSWSHETSGPALWTYITGFYLLAAGLAAPVLGAIADHTRSKKKFLAFCIGVGSLLACGLFFVTEGRYQLCGLLFGAAAFLWTCGNLFYDALLPGLSRDDREMDVISAAGYAVGYLGGGVLLAVNLAMVSKPHWFGFADAGIATRTVFLTVGAWWALFSLPVLWHVGETGGEPQDKMQQRPASHSPFRTPHSEIRNPVIEGFHRLAGTLRKIREYRQLARLLVAFIFYNTGIGTVITVAAIYGKDELGIPDDSLIACILMIQFIGFPASFGFIALAKVLGNRNAIFLGLAVYLGVVIFAFFMKTTGQFWLLGVMIGLVQGGTQALSRSLYGSMIPAGRAAEFFGFFSIFNKVGSFAGPLAFAIVRDATDSSRLAILFLAVFFIIGAAILATVNPSAGRPTGREGRLPRTVQETKI